MFVPNNIYYIILTTYALAPVTLAADPRMRNAPRRESYSRYYYNAVL